MSEFRVTSYPRAMWELISKAAFMATFGVNRGPEIERFDFVLVAIDVSGSIAGWITCKEMDAETLYWQYGGAEPSYFGSVKVLAGYMNFLNYALERYKRITTRIENTNTAMLKIALKLGFLITGVHNFNNKIFVELSYE